MVFHTILKPPKVTGWIIISQELSRTACVIVKLQMKQELQRTAALFYGCLQGGRGITLRKSMEETVAPGEAERDPWDGRWGQGQGVKKMRLMKEARREGQVTQFYCCHPLCRAEGM
jgi:hypothetical protein